jgi:predicted small lipoprotein YifL
MKYILSGRLPTIILLLSVLLAACGQTGALYMPQPYSPPSPEKAQTQGKEQKAPRENIANDTEKTDNRK